MKKIFFLILGLLVAITAYYFLFDIVDTNCHAINPYGNEILSKTNSIWIYVTVVSLLILQLLTLSLYFLKLDKRLNKYIAFGIMTGIGFIILHSLYIYSNNKDNGPRLIEFNQKEWIESNEKPIQMIREIHHNWTNHLSKDQIIKLLGVPTDLDTIEIPLFMKENRDSNTFHYPSDQYYSPYKYYMQIKMLKNTDYVEEVNLVLIDDYD
tara:strand:+ start:79 stop:705 length:627 start_codon:yes stop_codon:yes gene_type:complete